MTISTLDPNKPTDLEPAGEGAAQIRATKLAVKTAFPAVEAAITNAGGTDGAGDKIAPDAATFSALFAQVRALEGATAGVPLGTIIMWSSALNSTIPAGYTICDGSGALNGISVPDLRDRFIVAAGTVFADNDTPGGSSTSSSGGSGSGSASVVIDDHVAITADYLPEHEHFSFANVEANTTSGTPGNGTHSLTTVNTPAAIGVGGSSDRKYNMDSDSSTAATVGRTSASGGVPSASRLTHTAADITITGITHSHEVVQPYYTLTYIIRVGV